MYRGHLAITSFISVHLIHLCVYQLAYETYCVFHLSVHYSIILLLNIGMNVAFVAIEYTQHLIEQKAAQEKKLEELRKEVMALKIMKT